MMAVCLGGTGKKLPLYPALGHWPGFAKFAGLLPFLIDEKTPQQTTESL